MKYQYEVHISEELQKHCFADIIEIPAIIDAREGFWINRHGAFTRDLDDCTMWIPASQIVFVRKI